MALLRTRRAAVVLLVVFTLFSACGVSEQAGRTTVSTPSSDRAVVSSSTQAVVLPTIPPPPSPTTSVAVTTTIVVSTTRDAGPLEIVNGRFIGIGQGSLLADAAHILGVTPVAEHPDQAYTDTNSTTLAPACITSPTDHWAIYTGGLNLFFEGQSAATAGLTNWSYTGDPVAGFAKMVTAEGITIGNTRQDAFAAYPSAADYGDQLFVPGLRFGMDGDTIVWLGMVDCVFEEPDPGT